MTIELVLKAKHFTGAEYCNGGGSIKNASLDYFPDKPAFQGVEMSRVGGKRYYHFMYSKVTFTEDKLQAAQFDPETIVRTIILNLPD